ncbi:rcc01693 family protein [Cognatiyoonia sp. IB215182]|uniref:rcc01693 family protein n=1 Tax=Cognatiyoonia sp. IB215182 TaxID=3097353 RepID=UPI002A0E48BA|nr:rcc01693 family protein [Cognatiyoonia sp. IB215182]MDX8352214.1 rcc01693 family protein [Cognatiyoonia sp. IB215182]
MDWNGLLQAGLGRLHLRPAEFWALTPIELQLMLGVTGTQAPMGRMRLDDLLKAYPDEPKDEENG